MEVRTKSEKEELLDKKIEEVRKRNEARLKKFQEAEEDRKRAEEAGCAVNRKKPTFDDEDYFPPKQRVHNPKIQPQKPGSHRTKKYVPGTSEEWKEYIAAKNRSNAERGSHEENSNDSSLNENSSNNNNNSFHGSKKERTPKGNNRAIYVPKQLQNRDSPENVKPPPPDPRNSFLSDSYRYPTPKSKPDDVAKVEDQRAAEPRKQPATPATTCQGTFQGDARQRINQLRASRSQDQQPLPSESPDTRHGQNRSTHEHHRPTSQQKMRPNAFKNSKHIPPSDGRPPREAKGRETAEKPIKSILKRPKQVAEFDNCQPIIAVITTPGDDDDTYEEEVAQGYNRKKEAAICDWLKNSEFNNEEAGEGDDDDDEWEDVDEEEEEDGAGSQQEHPAEGKVDESIPVAVTITTKSGDEELEAFEEDNAAFQEFIMQHTLTLDKDYDGGLNWAAEMERLSLENKHKIDLEAVQKLQQSNDD